ncbi:MAG: DNA translocase FtsK [Xenococcaceae cyanobacterium]
MLYLKEAEDIRYRITQLALQKTLWIDTEVADWQTPNPRLSLIQVLADSTDFTGDATYILDVLDKPDLVIEFINQIMANPKIEKVFHNANFDLKYLGGKDKAQNVTCTLKIARELTKKSRSDRLEVSNNKLKTLAVELCHFSNVDTEEQRSDWGRRPLSEKQLHYAKMDTVYLAHVHRRLLEITNQSNRDLKGMKSKLRSQKFEPPSLSVTKIRVAFECPRLFYLHEHFGGKTLFVPPEPSPGIGTVFHQLCEQCIQVTQQNYQFQAVLSPAADQLNVEEVASRMEQLFYELVFYPYIDKNPDIASALPQIWQGLKALIQRWAELLVVNRHYCNAEEVIGKTFIAEEKKLNYEFTLPDGTQQRVGGRFDSLIFNCEKKRLCVVDYKTYEPVDPSAQLAQVSLYSYMIREKTKLPVDSAVYCVLPEFKEYNYSWEQLESTVHELIPHKLQQMRQWINWKKGKPQPPPPTTLSHLCDICPQQEKCQTFFGVVKPSPPPPPPPTPPPIIDPDPIGKQLVTTLQSFKINVDYLGAAVGPAFIRVKLKPNLGVRVASLLKLSADLQVQLGINNPPLIAPQPGYVSVDLPRKDRQIARFEDYIHSQKPSDDAPVKIAIGIDLDGELVEADLSDPNTCHFLVGGTTGSGKSEFLRSLLLSLLYRHSPQQLKIALVDPKRVTFPEFEQMSWLLSPVVKDSDAAIELMAKLVDEMERRYRLFEVAGCDKIDLYNRNSVNLLPRIVCIFDEYADFMAEKESRNALEQSIKRLGAMARAAGIHLIIATQRPEAKIVTPIIRSNLPGRVALRTASEADSAIILGGTSTEAAYLLGKGDLLYQLGAQLQRLQSLFASTIKVSQSECESSAFYKSFT